MTERKLHYHTIILVVMLMAVQAFGQSVDPLTGRARVSIPLWTINYAGVSVPISVWHHGGALRVEESEGSCGLGWNLSIGGAVSRQVRGLPDDYNVAGDDRKGWLFDNNADDVNDFTLSIDDVLDNCSDESGEYTFINNLGRITDSEPDMFYFSAPGLSGQFVFGSDGNPKLLSYQDLKFVVSKDANDRITQFVITTNLGMQYTFSVKENVTRKVYKNTPMYVSHFRTEYLYYQQPAIYTSVWHLSSITSKTTGKSATFDYDEADETESNRFIITIGSDNVADSLYYVRESVQPRQLASVVLGGYTATITWRNNLVRKVSIAEAAFSNAREFEFVYRGFISSTNTAQPKIHHYFLKEIKQLSNCQPFPDYSFKYQSVTFGSGEISTVVFPWETKFKQDYWGYYNGSSTNKNIPRNYYYSGESNGKRLRVHPIPGETATSSYSADNREVNSSTVGFGALTEISYPRGGKTTFTYEPHRYYDLQVSRSYYGGGVRVKKVTTKGGEAAYGGSSTATNSAHNIETEYDYELENDTTSGLISYPPKFAFATDSGIFRTPYLLGDLGEVLYSRVVEKSRSHGNTVYEFDVTGMFHYAGGTKSIIARSGGACTIGFFKNGVYTFPFAPHTNIDRGLIKKQTEYSSTGALVRQKRFTYTTLTPAAETVYGLRFERISNGFHFSKYGVSTGTIKALSQEVSIEIGEENAGDSTKTTVAYAYHSGHHMLETVTRTNDDGSIAKENTRYAKDYTFSSPSGDAAVAIKQLNDDNRHGEVIEKIQKFTPIGGTEQVNGGSLITYKLVSSKPLPYQFLSYPPVSTYFYQSAVSGSSFRNDSSYVLTRTIDEYDEEGNIVSESDNKKNVVGYHTTNNYAFPPVATFALCKGNEAVYEGFEMPTGRGFTYYSGIVPGWTGENGYTLGSLSSASISKRGNKYRVSCWSKAAQSTTVTFKAWNGSEVSGSSTPLSYNPTVMNTWVYLEGIMDVTNAPATFTTVLNANQTIAVDDVLALPVTASVALSTYKPLTGVTSQTDDRGNSVVFTYDSAGRKINTLDRKRYLVERKKYKLTLPDTLISIVAGFTSSNNFPRKGQSTTYTASTVSCVDNISYSWEIYFNSSTPVASGTGTTITHTFANMGPYTVKLTASHVAYESEVFAEDICVREPLPSTLALYRTGSATVTCNDVLRTFYLFHPQTSDTTKIITYEWKIKTSSYPYWTHIPYSPNAGSIDFESPNESYYIKCVMTIRYLEDLPGSSGTCPTACEPPPQETSEMYITFSTVNCL